MVKLCAVEDTLSGYETALFDAQKAILQIREGICVLKDRISKLSMAEKNPVLDSVVSDNDSMIPESAIGESSNPAKGDGRIAVVDSAGSTMSEDGGNEPQIIEAAEDKAETPEKNRHNWKEIIRTLLRERGQATTKQILRALADAGIIGSSDEKENKRRENCARSAIKYLEVSGVIRRLEKRYGSPWIIGQEHTPPASGANQL